MNIKRTMIKALRHTKWSAPQNVDEEKWYEACDKAIELVEQLKEPDETKMSLKELRRANELVKNVKILETLSKSEIEYLRVRYPDSRYDSVFMKGVVIPATFQDKEFEIEVRMSYE